MKLQTAKLLLLLVLLIGFSCSASRNMNAAGNANYRPALLNDATFLLTEISNDDSYGYSEKNPVKVGGANKSEGPLNERRFLNALAGPNGEPVSYERQGSCCHFKTPNGFNGTGLLDRYEVTWEGQQEPVILYINMYDYDVLKAPKGLTIIP